MSSAVSFRNGRWVDVLRKDLVFLSRGDNVHFAYDDRVEPSFDPFPHGREEGRCSDNLDVSAGSGPFQRHHAAIAESIVAEMQRVAGEKEQCEEEF